MSEVFPECRELEYVYDYGDNWQHRIVLEKVINDYGRNRVVCLGERKDASRRCGRGRGICGIS
ncbi:hypothetical protein D1970_18235 [Mesobacillus zeae]|uniref:Plasmid pRiA4b Orf3-like domain-containing protein n=1 Tax=Mesobacillus zeae TaxID=1917180 RepID=A0A398AYM4_9BACI|nr:hypothetical protein D1970_18235 [Mesobacillus zeae]